MANLYSTELAGLGQSPVSPPKAPAVGGRLKVQRATITLATQTTSDNIQIGKLPAGAVFAYGLIMTDTSLSTAVVAIGTNRTHASNGQYRAAAVFTATDTPTLFGVVAALDGDPLAADTPVYLTIATASLPASGILVIDLFYSQP